MKKLASLIGVFLVAFVGSFLWYSSHLDAVQPGNDERVFVTVEKGMSVSQIATMLAEQNLITSPLAFRVYTKLNGVEGGLQAGQFVVQANQSVEQIVTILRTGKAAELILTIPEGFTVSDIDTLLGDKELAEYGEFSSCARECDFAAHNYLPAADGLADRGGRVEGYLYPDTYFVIAADFTVEKFMNRLLNTFQEKVLQGEAEAIEASAYSLHEVITMASLIEEEASNDEERPQIADILWKRFDEGMGLGVDATVRYILNKPTADITVGDLNQNDPYNTRKFKGLPPGPIASPGLASIQAALSPAENEYWYYLHGKDGQIRYAKTNEQHNINRHTYIRMAP